MTALTARHPRLSRVLAVSAAVALGLGGALVVASPAAAATLTVNNTGPNGAGSLQQAILDANAAPGSEITFALPGAAPWVISVPAADPLPAITESTTITGPGSVALKIQNLDTTNTGLSANGCVDPATDVTIAGLTIDAFITDGLDLACVNLTASDLLLSNNGGMAMSYTGAPGNVANLTTITATGNVAGLSLFADSGTVITASGLHVSQSANDGVFVTTNAGATVEIGASDSSDNGQAGFSLGGSGVGTSIVLHDSSAARNGLYGVDVNAMNKSQVQVNGSDVSANTQGNIAGQLGDADVTIANSTANDSPNGGGIGFDVLGGSTLLITDSTVSGNADSGGGSHVVGSTIAISGSTFDNNGLAADGGGYLLYAESASAITIDNSVFTNNRAGFGGGIEANLDSDSTLDITASRISDNHAEPCGCGGSGDGGGLYIAGVNGDNSRFTLTDSQVTGNDSDGDGAGIYFKELGHDTFSGILGSTGGSTVLRTTIDDNHTGGGSFGGGVYVDNWSWKTNSSGDVPAITFDQSTISNNSALLGSALYVDKGTDSNGNVGILLLSSSTVSENDATGIGAVIFTSAFNDGALWLSHSTIASNGGGGFAGFLAIGSGEVDLDHALIADNGTDDLVVSGLSFSSRYSLVQNDLSGLLVGTGDITGVDPKLAPLAANGGPTKTMLIAPGSAAYNAGNPAFVAPPTTDQRGQPRVFQRVDIGAVEWQPALAMTGGGPRPQTPLIGLLLLFVGLALLAASRIRSIA